MDSQRTELICQSLHYKLHLTEPLLKQIEYLCSKFPNLEWSGVLFYKYKGSFDSKDGIEFEAVDLILQDIGSQGATEFEYTADVVGYQVDHDLLDCQVGLIHSHNMMQAFFSGTDVNTLREEGGDRFHFLSLIVNNAGNYVARVTKKVVCTEQVIKSSSYNTFGGKTISQENVPEERAYTVIEAFDLDIIKDRAVSSTLQELDEQIGKVLDRKEEEQKKEKAKRVGSLAGVNMIPTYSHTSLFEAPEADEWVPSKKSERKAVSPREDAVAPEEDSIPYGKIRYKPKTVEDMVKKLLYSSPIVDTDTANLYSFVPTMSSLYAKEFETPDSREFVEWKDGIIDYLLSNADVSDLADYNLDTDAEIAILAYDVKNRLSKLPNNKWIDAFIETLEIYCL